MLEQLLEKPDEQAFFYGNIMGGLSDNLMTIGQHAGTFLTCADCGQTFSVRANSWCCNTCGGEFTFKVESNTYKPDEDGKSFRARVRFDRLAKPGVAPKRIDKHWYLSDENWTVADLLVLLLRLPPEHYFHKIFSNLGIELHGEPTLRSFLAWPGFKFLGKTVQPDLAVGYERDLVLVEFKRPQASGGRKKALTPGWEVLGQTLFAMLTAKHLGCDWHVLFVPSRRALDPPSASMLLSKARAAAAAGNYKWPFPSEMLAEFQAMPDADVTRHLHSVSWEELLDACITAARDTCSNIDTPWTTTFVENGLHSFWRLRAAAGVLDEPLDVQGA
jgi:hypothetical protein